jgi:hypothetical protein
MTGIAVLCGHHHHAFIVIVRIVVQQHHHTALAEVGDQFVYSIYLHTLSVIVIPCAGTTGV